MPNGDPREGFFYPTLTLMLDSYILSFQFVYDGKKPPAPFPTYKDKWDIAHVRMPCSNQSEYPVHTKVDYKL